MKKMFSVLFLSAALFSLAACSAKPAEPAPVPKEAVSSSEPELQPAVPSSDITIGACIYKFDDPFMAAIRESMEARAESLGVSLEIVDSQNKQPIQNEQVDVFIAGGVDALIINPVDRTAVGPIIDKASMAGIPIILINRQPSEEDMYKYDSAWYVGAQPEQGYLLGGKTLIDYFKAHPEADKNNDGKIQYVMLQGEPGHADAALPAEYLIKGITNDGTFDEESLGNDTAMWDKVKAIDLMESFIASLRYDDPCGFDKLEAVLACNDDMALGALDAMKAEGYNTGDPEKFIPVIGHDATADALEAISRGELLGTVKNDTESQGIAAVNTAVAAVQWHEVNEDTVGYEVTDGKYIWIPYVKVTADNYQDFM